MRKKLKTPDPTPEIDSSLLTHASGGATLSVGNLLLGIQPQEPTLPEGSPV